jgi:hypothetical protein
MEGDEEQEVVLFRLENVEELPKKVQHNFARDNLQNKKKSLPKRGTKEMFVTEASEEHLSKKRKEWFEGFALVERIPRIKNLSTGVWNEDLHLAEITISKGKHLKNMGKIIKSKLFLHIEEAM